MASMVSNKKSIVIPIIIPFLNNVFFSLTAFKFFIYVYPVSGLRFAEFLGSAKFGIFY